MTFLALDLFCKAGGAGAGLARAGFRVVGVDREPQPNYPFEFVQADAYEYMSRPDRVRPDFIWASPPCQGRTAYKRRPGHVRPVDTDGNIARTRDMLRAAGVPYVIENVPGAPLEDPVRLCGSMFDETVNVRRHRIFESSFPMPQPACQHSRARGSFPQATNRKNRRKTVEVGVWRIPLDIQRQAMGIGWMTLEELSEAIPPAYAEWIGRHALAHLEGRGA